MDRPAILENSQEADIREKPRANRLPCGARHCYRCSDDCGVIANAWIMRDLADEQSGE